jgi:hypothetical protein
VIKVFVYVLKINTLIMIPINVKMNVTQVALDVKIMNAYVLKDIFTIKILKNVILNVILLA